MGELSFARQALEGADLAKRGRRTLGLLTDANRRPDRPRDPLSEELTAYEPMAIPTAEQGIKVLGTPIGHQDFVAAQLESVRREHEVLLRRIPSINDVQSVWLLLVHCASARACYNLRALRRSVVEEFARAHDVCLW